MLSYRDLSTSPLPAPLAQALDAASGSLPKRERTRRQLLRAATQVFSSRGIAASTIQEIADVAGVTTGTVYNHFDTKDAVVVAVAQWLAQTLCKRIADTQAGVSEGAQRMAIGQRRYMWLAARSPAWALLLLDVLAAVPPISQQIASYVLDDLRLGMAQKAFRFTTEAAALDLAMGTAARGMLSIALGTAPADHDVAVTTMLLRGLGMPFQAAAKVAARPLPEFGPPGNSHPI